MLPVRMCSHLLFGDLIGADEFCTPELEHELVENRPARERRNRLVGTVGGELPQRSAHRALNVTVTRTPFFSSTRWT